VHAKALMAEDGATAVVKAGLRDVDEVAAGRRRSRPRHRPRLNPLQRESAASLFE
jgi:hypothetical protein